MLIFRGEIILLTLLMKAYKSFSISSLFTLLSFLLILGNTQDIHAAKIFQQVTEYKGEVVNSNTGDPVPSAFISVEGTNISTVTNSEGEFSLKVPGNVTSGLVTISNLGYQSKSLPLDSFQRENTRIELAESVEELSEVSIFTATDAKALVRKMFAKAGDNLVDEPAVMTAFYREAIRKRNRNVSLSEAVLKIYKKPYTTPSKDEISVSKARKSVDYERLDTMALKLRGGPFNNLYSDLLKYPEYFFQPEELDDYTFTFDDPAFINNKYLYVVNFEMKDKSYPWYYGKLFIDAETNALVKASYNLNVDNRKIASSMFVRKKPSGVRLYPINVSYEVNYRENDGKWYFGYGSAELEFVVNWKRKLFNSRYTVNSEMAVTDWQTSSGNRIKRDDTFINNAVIMEDDVSGFTDSQFWGDDNIIEPEKSIQNAIEKIQRQMLMDL